MSKRFVVTLVAVFVWAFAQGVQAAVVTWTNGLGGKWSVAANWSPNGVPLAGDSVLMNERAATPSSVIWTCP